MIEKTVGGVDVAIAAAGQSLGIEMTMAQAGLMAGGVALATAIPAGPSNLGTFDLARAYLAYTVVSDVAREASRYGVAHASEPTYLVDAVKAGKNRCHDSDDTFTALVHRSTN